MGVESREFGANQGTARQEADGPREGRAAVRELASDVGEGVKAVATSSAANCRGHPFSPRSLTHFTRVVSDRAQPGQRPHPASPPLPQKKQERHRNNARGPGAARSPQDCPDAQAGNLKVLALFGGSWLVRPMLPFAQHSRGHCHWMPLGEG